MPQSCVCLSVTSRCSAEMTKGKLEVVRETTVVSCSSRYSGHDRCAWELRNTTVVYDARDHFFYLPTKDLALFLYISPQKPLLH